MNSFKLFADPINEPQGFLFPPHSVHNPLSIAQAKKNVCRWSSGVRRAQFYDDDAGDSAFPDLNFCVSS